MKDTFLSFRNISKRYTGVQALDSVEFDVKRGEVHCLTGENGSGKSTLIKIISGVEQPGPGAYMEIEGERIDHVDSIESMQRGVEVIYQDLSLFLNMTVAENIAFSQVKEEKLKFISKKKEKSIALQAMQRIGVDIPLDEVVGDLSMGDQQLVAICRALTSDINLLIMDEPTTALTRKEVLALFKVVRELQQQGIASLFVSHKLDEVFEIADRVTVLRDGKKIGDYPASELDSKKLSILMTGKTLEYTPYHFEQKNEAAPLLEVRGLSKENNYADIDLTLYPGEIVGLTGLLGSGRTELALSLFGMNPPDKGTILLEGKPLRTGSVQEAMADGIAYVPENRLVQGLVMPQSVGRNLAITMIRHLTDKTGFIEEEKFNEFVDSWITGLSIKVPSAEAPVQTLSGGNQQRIVLAKWIARQPKLLILDGPTVGIDVAAKGAIHSIIRELADKGIGIIIISDEVEEVHGCCNRVEVMHRGRLISSFDVHSSTAEDIQDTINRAS